MRRRALLASTSTLLAALAGCGHPDTVLDMEAATASDIVDEVTNSVRQGSDEATLMAEVATNGSARANGTRPPLSVEQPLLYEGRVYDVTATELGSREVTRYEITIDYDPEDRTPERGEIDYAALPAVDRAALGDLIPPQENRPENEGVDMGVQYRYGDAEIAESELVPDQQYDVVVHEGDRYRIDVNPERIDETAYRYEATERAADVETYADQVRQEYLFALSGLSDAERDVVEEAISETYFGESDAFRSIVDRLEAQPGLTVEEFYGTWLVEYDGTEYVTYARW